MRKRLLLPMTVLALIALLSSCTTDGGAPSSNPQGGSTVAQDNLPQVAGDKGAEPVITAPTGTPPSDLQVKDLIVGDGAEAVATSTLTVHYVLMAWSTGQVVESSWVSQPATFGLNQVIQGWQQGIPGMKVGGRRLLVIPPSLGYGDVASGPLAANETLIFVVDLIAVS
ncbi:MAG: FKBP-type peptidylprolyl isomerase [Actinobacteria bacterium]|jgi:peptidylprolyl isomerase|nr:FKBP-type peptidylprolyl isomerase [Actinomycetota bacterium]NCW34524.1 FKBP-type peptidylprolyl isomerase [Actinomycetota bacterium]NCZ73005.1 FKBP-type peptidylprolyl isomerase [Actinomycetota bacterium]NDA41042.1 FKBP-type peptidylprolyl isomerase [Actinomycetota bacterium]NDB30896.1 FKBP-type peptidylprolyl isomerase [Actinomycetota bacterium]